MYLRAVEDVFGSEVDYAQLVKMYGAALESAKARYSPAEPQTAPDRYGDANGKSEFELMVCLQDVSNPVPRSQIHAMF